MPLESEPQVSPDNEPGINPDDDLVDQVVDYYDTATSVEDPWSSKGDAVEYFYGQGYSQDNVRAAVDAAAADRRVFYWHGLATYFDRERLRAVIVDETEGDGFTRRLLVAKANRWLNDAEVASPEVEA